MTQTKSRATGLLPIVDGPWKGGQVALALGTFETDDEEMAPPLTVPLPGVERVRYYRQEAASGLVWSVQIRLTLLT